MKPDKIINRIKNNTSWMVHRRAALEIMELARAGQWQDAMPIRMAFLSSFTIEPLVDYVMVESAAVDVLVTPYIAPYGQLAQDILNPESSLYTFDPEIVFIAAEHWALDSHPVSAANNLIDWVDSFKKQSSSICVLCTFMAVPSWPLHILQGEQDVQLHQANRLLKTTFASDPQVQICDVDQLAAYYGYVRAYSPQMMSMAKIPFSEDFLAILAHKVMSHIQFARGLTKKCLVLDCDNTLWGGIIGEDGMNGIALGPDWPGREFVDFQRAILELYDQGVILAINSKNNEADVLNVLHSHPHMLLKEKHLAGFQINWQPKPDNMRRLAEQINIGLDSIVFVDDNPTERDMMRQMLPEVLTLEMPDNPSCYAKTLRETNCFAKASLTEEDKKRGQIYAAQRQRNQLEQSTASLVDFLKSLNMVCSIRSAGERDIKRAAQLTQRTNQFNLTTRRYTEADIKSFIENDGWNVYVLGLRDKFGDNGTVGLAMVEKQSDCWRIDTFLMSCRVIGRQVEDAFVDRICMEAKAGGITTVTAEYIQTAKNGLTKAFWPKMNFDVISDSNGEVAYQCDILNYKHKTFDYLGFME